MRFIDAFYRDAPNRTTLFDKGARTDGQYDYIGQAPKGSSEGSKVWVVYKFTYDGSNFVSRIDSVGEASWTLRDEYFS